MSLGKKTWVFSDGDLPPRGDSEPFGHEALMIVNAGKENAEINMTLLFEDKDSAKEFYKGLNKGVQKGKWVYWGTEDAIEDFDD